MVDVTIKSVPEGITEKEVTEWVAILVERKEQQKLAPPADKVTVAQTTVDSFREANNLEKKYSKVVEVPVEPVAEPEETQ